MRNRFAAIFAATLFAVVAPSIAQQAQPAAAQAAEAAFAEAEVRKVDKSAGKVTLKHGEIKTLDMPPMTMVFGVKDAAMLNQVKAGDKIRFRASNEGGAYTVIEIQPAK
jgi:Cu(I)/Ag(I) efflux system periplasmic protein CusF